MDEKKPFSGLCGLTPAQAYIQWCKEKQSLQTNKDFLLARPLSLSYFPECESTNDLAKEKVFSNSYDPLEQVSLFLTDHQTKGRGRGSHHWHDDSQGQYLSSYSFKLSEAPSPLMSLLIGLGLYRVCLSSWPEKKWSLKAPNDLLLNGKKTAGLLIENVQQGSKNQLIIGLGFNVLSCPKNGRKNIYSDIISSEFLESEKSIEFKEWGVFLDRLLFEWSQLLLFTPQTSLSEMSKPNCSKNTLQESTCHSLRYALNQNPSLPEKVLEVCPDGSLIFPSKTQHWSEL